MPLAGARASKAAANPLTDRLVRDFARGC
jgi:hypothetical protein